MKHTLTAIALLSSGTLLAEEVKPFTMDGEFGLIVTTGNTENVTVKGALSAKQELESWSNEYAASVLYAESQTTDADGNETTEATDDEYFLSAQGNYKLANPDHRLFIFGSYEADEFSGFDFQSTVAAGWSQKVWGNDVSSFEYSIGPGYSMAETDDGEEINNAIVRGSLGYNWNVSDNAVFNQTLSTEVGSDNTKSKSVTSLSAKLSGGLSMKVSLTLDHNSDVTEGTEKLDTQTAVTLVYTFF